MTGIWARDGSDWRLLAPVGFPDEATLHNLVEQTPQLLPLSGSPRLAVVGREVSLGSGYADLLAVEDSGRFVVIEIKLARNSEARRAVVAQILSYAADLKGSTLEPLERSALGSYLRKHGSESVADAVRSVVQEGGFDPPSFIEAAQESLSKGQFRLVLVLDEVPDDLVRLVGYLEGAMNEVAIDLITVRAFEVDGREVVVPQRIDPERWRPESAAARASLERGLLIDGAQDFLSKLETASDGGRIVLERLTEWAMQLESRGYVRLFTYRGRGGVTTLLPRLKDEGVGLVTIYNDNGRPYLQFWRSVFERRAPGAIPGVEEALGAAIGQGKTVKDAGDGLLERLTDAYAQASAGHVDA